MQIVEVEYGELKSGKGEKRYENARVCLRATLAEGENHETALGTLKILARKELGIWYNGDSEKYLEENLEEKRKELEDVEEELNKVKTKLRKAKNLADVLGD